MCRDLKQGNAHGHEVRGDVSKDSDGRPGTGRDNIRKSARASETGGEVNRQDTSGRGADVNDCAPKTCVSDTSMVERVVREYELQSDCAREEERSARALLETMEGSIAAVIFINVCRLLETSVGDDLSCALASQGMQPRRTASTCRLLNLAEHGSVKDRFKSCAALMWRALGGVDDSKFHEMMDRFLRDNQACVGSAAGHRTILDRHIVELERGMLASAGSRLSRRGSGSDRVMGLLSPEIARTKDVVRSSVCRKCLPEYLDLPYVTRLKSLGDAERELAMSVRDLQLRERECRELTIRADKVWGVLEAGYRRRIGEADAQAEFLERKVKSAYEEAMKCKQRFEPLKRELKELRESEQCLRAAGVELDRQVAATSAEQKKLHQQCAKAESHLRRLHCETQERWRTVETQLKDQRESVRKLEELLVLRRKRSQDVEQMLSREAESVKGDLMRNCHDMLCADRENEKLAKSLQNLQTETKVLLKATEKCRAECLNKVLKLAEGLEQELEKSDCRGRSCGSCSDIACQVFLYRTQPQPTESAEYSSEELAKKLVCSCDSMRRRVIKQFYAEIVYFMAQGIKEKASQLPCKLLECLQLQKYDKAAKKTLRDIVLNLLTNDLEISIGRAMEKGRSKIPKAEEWKKGECDVTQTCEDCGERLQAGQKTVTSTDYDMLKSIIDSLRKDCLTAQELEAVEKQLNGVLKNIEGGQPDAEKPGGSEIDGDRWRSEIDGTLTDAVPTSDEEETSEGLSSKLMFMVRLLRGMFQYGASPDGQTTADETDSPQAGPSNVEPQVKPKKSCCAVIAYQFAVSQGLQDDIEQGDVEIVIREMELMESGATLTSAATEMSELYKSTYGISGSSSFTMNSVDALKTTVLGSAVRTTVKPIENVESDSHSDLSVIKKSAEQVLSSSPDKFIEQMVNQYFQQDESPMASVTPQTVLSADTATGSETTLVPVATSMSRPEVATYTVAVCNPLKTKSARTSTAEFGAACQCSDCTRPPVGIKESGIQTSQVNNKVSGSVKVGEKLVGTFMAPDEHTVSKSTVAEVEAAVLRSMKIECKPVNVAIRSKSAEPFKPTSAASTAGPVRTNMRNLENIDKPAIELMRKELKEVKTMLSEKMDALMAAKCMCTDKPKAATKLSTNTPSSTVPKSIVKQKPSLVQTKSNTSAPRPQDKPKTVSVTTPSDTTNAAEPKKPGMKKSTKSKQPDVQEARKNCQNCHKFKDMSKLTANLPECRDCAYLRKVPSLNEACGICICAECSSKGDSAKCCKTPGACLYSKSSRNRLDSNVETNSYACPYLPSSSKPSSKSSTRRPEKSKCVCVKRRADTQMSRPPPCTNPCSSQGILKVGIVLQNEVKCTDPQRSTRGNENADRTSSRDRTSPRACCDLSSITESLSSLSSSPVRGGHRNGHIGDAPTSRRRLTVRLIDDISRCDATTRPADDARNAVTCELGSAGAQNYAQPCCETNIQTPGTPKKSPAGCGGSVRHAVNSGHGPGRKINFNLASDRNKSINSAVSRSTKRYCKIYASPVKDPQFSAMSDSDKRRPKSAGRETASACDPRKRPKRPRPKKCPNSKQGYRRAGRTNPSKQPATRKPSFCVKKSSQTIHYCKHFANKFPICRMYVSSKVSSRGSRRPSTAESRRTNDASEKSAQNRAVAGDVDSDNSGFMDALSLEVDGREVRTLVKECLSLRERVRAMYEQEIAANSLAASGSKTDVIQTKKITDLLRVAEENIEVSHGDNQLWNSNCQVNMCTCTQSLKLFRPIDVAQNISEECGTEAVDKNITTSLSHEFDYVDNVLAQSSPGTVVIRNTCFCNKFECPLCAERMIINMNKYANKKDAEMVTDLALVEKKLSVFKTSNSNLDVSSKKWQKTSLLKVNKYDIQHVTVNNMFHADNHNSLACRCHLNNEPCVLKLLPKKIHLEKFLQALTLSEATSNHARFSSPTISETFTRNDALKCLRSKLSNVEFKERSMQTSSCNSKARIERKDQLNQGSEARSLRMKRNKSTKSIVSLLKPEDAKRERSGQRETRKLLRSLLDITDSHSRRSECSFTTRSSDSSVSSNVKRKPYCKHSNKYTNLLSTDSKNLLNLCVGNYRRKIKRSSKSLGRNPRSNSGANNVAEDHTKNGGNANKIAKKCSGEKVKGDTTTVNKCTTCRSKSLCQLGTNNDIKSFRIYIRNQSKNSSNKNSMHSGRDGQRCVSTSTHDNLKSKRKRSKNRDELTDAESRDSSTKSEKFNAAMRSKTVDTDSSSVVRAFSPCVYISSSGTRSRKSTLPSRSSRCKCKGDAKEKKARSKSAKKKNRSSSKANKAKTPNRSRANSEKSKSPCESVCTYLSKNLSSVLGDIVNRNMKYLLSKVLNDNTANSLKPQYDDRDVTKAESVHDAPTVNKQSAKATTEKSVKATRENSGNPAKELRPKKSQDKKLITTPKTKPAKGKRDKSRPANDKKETGDTDRSKKGRKAKKSSDPESAPIAKTTATHVKLESTASESNNDEKPPASPDQETNIETSPCNCMNDPGCCCLCSGPKKQVTEEKQCNCNKPTDKQPCLNDKKCNAMNVQPSMKPKADTIVTPTLSRDRSNNNKESSTSTSPRKRGPPFDGLNEQVTAVVLIKKSQKKTAVDAQSTGKNSNTDAERRLDGTDITSSSLLAADSNLQSKSKIAPKPVNVSGTLSEKLNSNETKSPIRKADEKRNKSRKRSPQRVQSPSVNKERKRLQSSSPVGGKETSRLKSPQYHSQCTKSVSPPNTRKDQRDRSSKRLNTEGEKGPHDKNTRQSKQYVSKHNSRLSSSKSRSRKITPNLQRETTANVGEISNRDEPRLSEDTIDSSHGKVPVSLDEKNKQPLESVNPNVQILNAECSSPTCRLVMEKIKTCFDSGTWKFVCESGRRQTEVDKNEASTQIVESPKRRVGMFEYLFDSGRGSWPSDDDINAKSYDSPPKEKGKDIDIQVERCYQCGLFKKEQLGNQSSDATRKPEPTDKLPKITDDKNDVSATTKETFHNTPTLGQSTNVGTTRKDVETALESITKKLCSYDFVRKPSVKSAINEIQNKNESCGFKSVAGLSSASRSCGNKLSSFDLLSATSARTIQCANCKTILYQRMSDNNSPVTCAICKTRLSTNDKDACM